LPERRKNSFINRTTANSQPAHDVKTTSFWTFLRRQDGKTMS